MSFGANETDIRYWTDYANPRDGICFRKEDAHTLVHEHYELERIKAENAKLRELCADLYAEMLTYSTAPNYNASVWAVKLRELVIEVDEAQELHEAADTIWRSRNVCVTLRDQLDAKEHNERRNLREYARVCKENDRLRELVEDLFDYATDTCLKATNGPEQTRRFVMDGADLADRARRLGCSVLNDKEAE